MPGFPDRDKAKTLGICYVMTGGYGGKFIQPLLLGRILGSFPSAYAVFTHNGVGRYRYLCGFRFEDRNAFGIPGEPFVDTLRSRST